MKYPTHTIINGVDYPICIDYRVALECFHIIEDEEISDRERALAIIYKLFGVIPQQIEDIQEMLRIAQLYLGCGENQDIQTQRKKDMDFEYDWKFIVASFMSDYGIDLNQCNMHWYQFINLMQGLTETAILSRVREIRNYDLSQIKDMKTKNQMLKAQKSVELPKKYTQSEQKVIDEFESLFE